MNAERITKALAAHRLDTSCGWRAGFSGFRSWCACGWSSKALPDSEVQYGVESELGVALHEPHVAETIAAELFSTIEVVEQLSRIPAGAIVVSDEGGVFEKDSDGRWLEPGNSWKLTNNDLALPVRVLYTPGGEW